MPIRGSTSGTFPRMTHITSFVTVPLPAVATQRGQPQVESSPLDVVRRRVQEHPGMQELLMTWRPIVRQLRNEDALRTEIGREAARCGFPLFLAGPDTGNLALEDEVTTPVLAVANSGSE